MWCLLPIVILLLLGVGVCAVGFFSVAGLNKTSTLELANQLAANANNALTTTPSTASTNTSVNVMNFRPVAVTEADLTDSQLANALFTPADISGITALGPVRPSVVELNSHLDPTPPDNYSFFDGRAWYALPSGDLRISSAVVKNLTSADAVNFITVRSAGKTLLSDNGITQGIGDQSVMYYEPASDAFPASVTIRFTRSTLAAKITVYAMSDEVKTEAEFQTTLTTMALAVAEAQDARLQDFLANTLPVVEASPSLTSSALVSLSNATLVGRIPVTEQEWMGVTADYGLDSKITGLADAAVSSFSVDARPEEVVEVTILDFYGAEFPGEHLSQLITSDNVQTEVTLPAGIADVADALANETIAESQMVMGSYLIDVSVFSPFGTLDQAAATQDLIKWTQELNTILNAQ